MEREPPEGFDAWCSRCGKPFDYNTDMYLCPQCEKEPEMATTKMTRDGLMDEQKAFLERTGVEPNVLVCYGSAAKELGSICLGVPTSIQSVPLTVLGCDVRVRDREVTPAFAFEYDSGVEKAKLIHGHKTATHTPFDFESQGSRVVPVQQPTLPG